MSQQFVESREFYDHINEAQIERLGIIILGSLGVLIAGWIWPNFFQYRYLFLPDDFWFVVLSYWPAYAWAGGLTLLGAIVGAFKSTYFFDEEFLWRGIITSVGAGVTEEAWFRGVSVFYAMVGLIILNWFMSVVGWLFIGLSGLAIGFGLFFIVALLVQGQATLGSLFKLFFGMGFSGVVMWGLLTYNHDPLYNIYEHIFYPIINFTTFGLMEPVWSENHQAFLVMGMVSANFTFRDGHKYLGLVGWTNSWFIGCVFMYATLVHGLWVAIVVHALYDILIVVLQYLGRRFNGGR